MPNTFNLISSYTVPAGGTSTVTFSAIPQTYTDLKLVMATQNNRSNGNYGYQYVAINGSTANQYYRSMYGEGSGVQNSNAETGNYIQNYSTGTVWQGTYIYSNGEIYYANYTSSEPKVWKTTSVSEGYNALDRNLWNFFAGSWTSNDPITSLVITTNGGAGFTTWSANSTFYLYGIKKA